MMSEGQKCTLYGMSPIMASKNLIGVFDFLESRESVNTELDWNTGMTFEHTKLQRKMHMRPK